VVVGITNEAHYCMSEEEIDYTEKLFKNIGVDEYDGFCDIGSYLKVFFVYISIGIVFLFLL
jgi:hypothetical protein